MVVLCDLPTSGKINLNLFVKPPDAFRIGRSIRGVLELAGQSCGLRHPVRADLYYGNPTTNSTG